MYSPQCLQINVPLSTSLNSWTNQLSMLHPLLFSLIQTASIHQLNSLNLSSIHIEAACIFIYHNTTSTSTDSSTSSVHAFKSYATPSPYHLITSPSHYKFKIQKLKQPKHKMKNIIKKGFNN